MDYCLVVDVLIFFLRFVEWIGCATLLSILMLAVLTTIDVALTTTDPGSTT